jgi:hypothetical protein
MFRLGTDKNGVTGACQPARDPKHETDIRLFFAVSCRCKKSRKEMTALLAKKTRY